MGGDVHGRCRPRCACRGRAARRCISRATASCARLPSSGQGTLGRSPPPSFHLLHTPARSAPHRARDMHALVQLRRQARVWMDASGWARRLVYVDGGLSLMSVMIYILMTYK